MIPKINQRQFLDGLQSPSQTPISSGGGPPELRPDSLAAVSAREHEKVVNNEIEQDRRLITELFSRLNVIFPAGFHQLNKLNSDEAQLHIKQLMRVWLNELKIRQIDNPMLIDYALARLRSEGTPFMPTVGRFVELCEEGRIPEGTKTVAESYTEIYKYSCQPEECHEPSLLSLATYHTFSVICERGGWGAFKKLGQANAFEFWSRHYEDTLQLLKAGKALRVAPPPVEKLEHLFVPAKPETVSRALFNMRKGLK